MKIKCDECGEDISLLVDKCIEEHIPGRIKCPKCFKLQDRYISEADLMTYFTISCLGYIVVAYILMKVIEIVGFKWYMIVFLLLAFIGIYFLQKMLSRLVYKNAYGKADYKNLTVMEDCKSITKRMRIQYAVFICLIIMLGTGTYDIWIFVVAGLVFTIVSYIKLKLLIKKEKASTVK